MAGCPYVRRMEQEDAIRYLSLQEADSYDVWINADNKAFDNWLYLEGKPTSGSRIRASLPPLTQLLPLGLGIIARPLPRPLGRRTGGRPSWTGRNWQSKAACAPPSLRRTGPA